MEVESWLCPDMACELNHLPVQAPTHLLLQIEHLVELEPLRKSLVGVPGKDGLSVEQRKRLTIAVELVANPSIIFMDVSALT